MTNPVNSQWKNEASCLLKATLTLIKDKSLIGATDKETRANIAQGLNEIVKKECPHIARRLFN